jgi:hypothetical protein
MIKNIWVKARKLFQPQKGYIVVIDDSSVCGFDEYSLDCFGRICDHKNAAKYAKIEDAKRMAAKINAPTRVKYE